MNTYGPHHSDRRIWVDGDLAFGKGDFQFRDDGHEEVNIEQYWMNISFGGGRTSPIDNHDYFDDLRISPGEPVTEDLETRKLSPCENLSH